MPGQRNHEVDIETEGGCTNNCGCNQIQCLGPKLLLFLVLCILPSWATLQMYLSGGIPWPVPAYIVLSILTFIVYQKDKRSAERNEWRTPEKTLHFCEFIGGWPGALIAQQYLRHKTQKTSFLAVSWVFVVLHQVGWGLYLLQFYFLPETESSATDSPGGVQIAV